MADSSTKPTRVSASLIQSKDGMVRQVRVNGVVLDVFSAGPTMQEGEVVLVMTLRNVDISGERAADPTPAEDAGKSA
jgi:hypothetical protein